MLLKNGGGPVNQVGFSFTLFTFLFYLHFTNNTFRQILLISFVEFIAVTEFKEHKEQTTLSMEMSSFICRLTQNMQGRV